MYLYLSMVVTYFFYYELAASSRWEHYNILQDYMNYRKYKYFRLDGSSTIMDRRDMVRDFQRR